MTFPVRVIVWQSSDVSKCEEVNPTAVFTAHTDEESPQLRRIYHTHIDNIFGFDLRPHFSHADCITKNRLLTGNHKLVNVIVQLLNNVVYTIEVSVSNQRITQI
jgi:hypothetical protein